MPAMLVRLFAVLLLDLCVASISLPNPCILLEDGARQPHPHQCNHFITCKDQMMKSIAKCPPGLHFNRRLGVCDLISRANCLIDAELQQQLERMSGQSEYSCDCCSYCRCADSVPSLQPSSTLAPTPNATNAPSEMLSSCWTAANCNKKGACENQPDGAMFPDPASNGYIVCQCECEIPMPCPSGLIFNPELNVCDWPEIGNMKTTTPSSSTTSATPRTPYNSTTPVGSSTHFESSTADTSNLSSDTSTTATSLTPSDSTSNGRNASSLSTTFNLSSTTDYLPSITTSTPFETSTVNISTSSSSTTTTSTSSISTSTTWDRFSTPSTSSEFPKPVSFTDSSTKSTTIASFISRDATPNSLAAFSKPSHPSEGPSGTTCNNKGVCENQPDGTMFPELDSIGYIVCQCECEIHMPCPSGLVFNPSLNVCDWASAIDSDSNNNGPSTDASCNQTGVCDNQWDGAMFPDPESNGYIVCQDECEIPMPCPSDLIFNPELNVCDWPEIGNMKTTTPSLSTTTITTTPTTPSNASTADSSTVSSGTTTVDISTQSTSTVQDNFSSSLSTTADTSSTNPSTSFDTSTDSSLITSHTSTTVSFSISSDSTSTEKDVSSTSTTSDQNTSSTPFESSTINFSTASTDTTTTNVSFSTSSTSSISTDTTSTQQQASSTLSTTSKPISPSEGPSGSTASTLSTTSKPISPSEGPSGTTCNRKGVCENQPDGTMFPELGSNGYIVCQCECEIHMPCPSGLEFNPLLNVCDWPNSTSGSDTGSGSYVPSVPAPAPSAPVPPEHPANGPSGTTCNRKGVCENQQDGSMFPEIGSSGYIVCQCECEVPMPCPNGLVFNPDVAVCDWPQTFT